jgi:hypothetical protein
VGEQIESSTDDAESSGLRIDGLRGTTRGSISTFF